MSLKIYLLRHGETSYSQNGTYCGSIDPGLTVEGSQMAQAFANTYKCCNGQVKQDTLLSRLFIKFPLILNRGLIA